MDDALTALRGRGFAFTAAVLGEATVSDADADLYAARCQALLARLTRRRRRRLGPRTARQPLRQAVGPGPSRAAA
jgi:hypothetical protein